MFAVAFLIFLMCLPANFTQAPDDESVPALVCLGKENVTADNAFEFFTKNISMAEVMPNLKCYAACCLEGMHALGGNCSFQPESGKRYVSDNGLRKDLLSAFDGCHNASIGITERCECGYQIFKCINEYTNIGGN